MKSECVARYFFSYFIKMWYFFILAFPISDLYYFYSYDKINNTNYHQQENSTRKNEYFSYDDNFTNVYNYEGRIGNFSEITFQINTTFHDYFYNAFWAFMKFYDIAD